MVGGAGFGMATVCRKVFGACPGGTGLAAAVPEGGRFCGEDGFVHRDKFMKSHIRNGVVGVLALFICWQRAFGGEIDPAGTAMLQEAQRILAAYHAGQPPATNTLRVVYFVPKDGTPLPGYEERLDRGDERYQRFLSRGT